MIIEERCQVHDPVTLTCGALRGSKGKCTGARTIESGPWANLTADVEKLTREKNGIPAEVKEFTEMGCFCPEELEWAATETGDSYDRLILRNS